VSFRFLQPSNEDDFELCSLRFLREVWKCNTLALYGKRGERQDGIDIIDESGTPPLRAAQCKFHESNKTLTPSEIKDEVAKVLNSTLPIREYHILTTARKTRDAQNTAIKINVDHDRDGRPKIYLWFWSEKIETHLSEMDDATRERVLHGDSGRCAPAISRLILSTMTDFLDRPLYAAASVLDGEIDAIRALIERHENEVAEHKIHELETRAADKLQDSHRYALVALRSRLLMDKGEWEKVGRDLLDARRFKQSTDRARINEALGFELIGDRVRAHEITTTLRQEITNSDRLTAIWIRTAPDSTPFEELEAVAAPFAKESDEIHLALAHSAMAREDYDRAWNHAKRVTELEPDLPQGWFLCGLARHAIGHKSGSVDRLRLLGEAEVHYGKAAEFAKCQKMSDLQAVILYNRGNARFLLGDHRAETDLQNAVELAPDRGHRIKYAGFLVDGGRFQDALSELAREGGQSLECRFLEAAARRGRNGLNDRVVASQLLQDVLNAGDSERSVDAHFLHADWARQDGKQEEALAILNGSSLREKHLFVFHTLRAWLLITPDSSVLAKPDLDIAHALAAPTLPKHQLFLLAQILLVAKDFDRTLPLLEQCVEPGRFGTECQYLLECASRLNRDDVLVRVCRELREAGETDTRLLQTEVQTLQKYDPEQAIRIVRDYLARYPEDRHATLWLSMLAMRLERSELRVTDLARLPEPRELSPQASGVVVNLLRDSGQHNEALRYAYQTLREHFDEEMAHAGYIWFFLFPSQDMPTIVDDGVAGLGKAVCYREDRDETDRWVVIEDEFEADASLLEIDPIGPLAQTLTGHRVGQVVTIAPDETLPRKATIREILNKHVYRGRDSLHQFQIRFPRSSAFRLWDVGPGPNIDLSPLREMGERRRQHLDRLETQYRTSPLPIHTYAELAGWDEFAAWMQLTRDPRLGIRCFHGQSPEFQIGVELLKQSSTIVLDLTSLCTLGHLDLLRLLGDAGKPFVVSQSTWDRLRELTDRDLGSTIEGTPDEQARHIQVVQSVRVAVAKGCRIVPCLELADLDPNRRKQLISLLGRHNLEALMIGSREGHVLWADDLPLGLLGRMEFGTKHCSIQMILFDCLERGNLNSAEHHQAVAKLCGWHYQSIFWGPETLVAAAHVAGWDMTRWPVRNVIRLIANCDLDILLRFQYVVAVIRLVWQEQIVLYSKQEFLFALLRTLNHRSLVQRLRQAGGQLFSFNVLAATEVIACLDYWLGIHHRREES